MHHRHDYVMFLLDLATPSSFERRTLHVRAVDVIEATAWFERHALEEKPERFGYDSREAYAADVRTIRRAFLKTVIDAGEYVTPVFGVLDDARLRLLQRIAFACRDAVFESFVEADRDAVGDLAEMAERLLLVEEDSDTFDQAVDEVRRIGVRLHDALSLTSDVPERQRAKTELVLLAYAIRRLSFACGRVDNMLVVQGLIGRLRSLGL